MMRMRGCCSHRAERTACVRMPDVVIDLFNHAFASCTTMRTSCIGPARSIVNVAEWRLLSSLTSALR